MSDWEPTDAGPPADELELTDLELLNDLTHPVRGVIFRRLRQPHSAAELAAELDMPVTRLYHHLNRLEQLGIIHVVATRRVGAALERRYQTTARSLKLSDASIDLHEPREVSQAMGAMYDFAKLRLQREIETGAFHDRENERDTLISFHEMSLTDAQREHLVTRLKDVVDELLELDDATDRGPRRYVVFVAAHPVAI